MLKKSRLVPKELLMMRSLNARMQLLEQDQRKYMYAEKGFAGEVTFDVLTESLQSDCLIINGLWLKVNDSTFQIDSILNYQKKIYLIDVKNYEGDYHYDPDGRLRKADRFLKDPFNQLQRADTLFRQLLQQYGFQANVESYVVYINPEFTLYNAPQNEFVILPSQINRFLKKLNKEYSRLNEGHERLADLLVSLDLIDSPFATYPPYDYEQLFKGILCPLCHRLSTFVKGNKIVCAECGAEEPVDTAVVRSVGELMMLFPELRITTNLVFEWCGGIGSHKMIRRILLQNFESVGKTKFRYFIIKE